MTTIRAQLSDVEKDRLRQYWTRLYPQDYVDGLLGKDEDKPVKTVPKKKRRRKPVPICSRFEILDL